MSGIKDKALSRFYRMLHARGESVGTIAEKIGTTRAHLTQVFNHTRARVPRLRKAAPNVVPQSTWLKVVPYLKPEELELLALVPRGTKFHEKEAA